MAEVYESYFYPSSDLGVLMYMAILCGGPADGMKWALMEAVPELYWRVVSGEIPGIAEPSDPIEPSGSVAITQPAKSVKT